MISTVAKRTTERCGKAELVVGVSDARSGGGKCAALHTHPHGNNINHKRHLLLFNLKVNLNKSRNEI